MDGSERTLDDVLADLVGKVAQEIKDRPKSASEFLAKQRKTALYQVAIDNDHACGCGGRDGVLVAVPGDTFAPTVAGMVVVTAFAHHDNSRTQSAFLTTEEAKQLVNRLGEAIAAAEQFNATRS